MQDLLQVNSYLFLLIKAYATLASHDVDVCLIPEVDVDLYDSKYGVLPHIRRCLHKKHHCIVVISEGIIIPGLEGDVINFILIISFRAQLMLVVINVILMLVYI